jgi:hypothetical protein
LVIKVDIQTTGCVFPKDLAGDFRRFWTDGQASGLCVRDKRVGLDVPDIEREGQRLHLIALFKTGPRPGIYLAIARAVNHHFGEYGASSIEILYNDSAHYPVFHNWRSHAGME